MQTAAATDNHDWCADTATSTPRPTRLTFLEPRRLVVEEPIGVRMAARTTSLTRSIEERTHQMQGKNEYECDSEQEELHGDQGVNDGHATGPDPVPPGVTRLRHLPTRS
jgi:hypothetical protein